MRNRAELPHFHKKHLQETYNVLVNGLRLATGQGRELSPLLLSIILGLLTSAKGTAGKGLHIEKEAIKLYSQMA